MAPFFKLKSTFKLKKINKNIAKTYALEFFAYKF